MATITTRSGKGSPLTNNEVDANFTNLNNDKLEISAGTATIYLGQSSGTAEATSLASVFDGTSSFGTATATFQSVNGLTFPATDGTSGQALTTDGNGVLSFDDAGISTGKAIAMAIVFG